MNTPSDLLLAVWREVCRHTHIQESSEAITRMLAAHTPVSGIVVREFDLTRSSLETVAASVPGGEVAGGGRTEYPEAEMRRVLAWCRRGRVEGAGGSAPRQEWGPMIPKDVEGDVLIGPWRTIEGRWVSWC